MMVIFNSSLIFVLSMISLTLSLSTVTKTKTNVDISMKLHIFFVQATVILSVLMLFASGCVLLRGVLLLC
jgi:hypothetical protein